MIASSSKSIGGKVNMNHDEASLLKDIVRLEAEVSQLKLQRQQDYANLIHAAQSAKAAKNGFLTNMSHELRTPLTAIIGFAELLSDQHFGKLNERQYTYVREIYNAGHQLLSLVKDILDLAKAESGSQTLNVSEVNIEDLLTKSLSMVRERATRHLQKLEINLDTTTKGLVIKADEIKLKQVMFNLLTNAVKFTPDGGSISLIAGRQGDVVSVCVSDSGIGIKKEDLPRIFDVFEQIDDSQNRIIPGTGLGLALTKRLVELHGGEITAVSEGAGQGCAISFTIPVDVSASRNGEASASVHSVGTVD